MKHSTKQEKKKQPMVLIYMDGVDLLLASYIY